jgi:exonuclease SbcC
MRPERLELSGFTAFRQPTVIDFEGADLFALCGATGAGKSSIIDAITFALYGTVARYDDERLVAPIISQGQAETQVRLDFSVGAEQYTAVRVVRATSTGKATTKEARLERRLDDGDTDVLAGDAAGLTAAVEGLLGLGFRQFTTCAVLPQGQFARFLHAKPGERRDLLVRLLSLGLYGDMAKAAHERAAIAQQRVVSADQDLARVAFASPEALTEAAAAHAQLGALLERIEAAQPQLDELNAAVAEVEREADEVERRHADLRGLSMPEGVEQIANKARLAREEAAQADRDLAAAQLVLEQVETEVAALEAAAELRAALERHREHAEQLSRAEALTPQLHEATAARAGLDEEMAAADVVLDGARAELEQARVADRAADLRGHLHAGEACPVCQQVVDQVPELDRSDLDASEARVKEAEAVRRDYDKAHRDAERALARLEEQASAVQERLAVLSGDVGRLAEPAEVEAALGRRIEADAGLDRARTAEKRARTQRDKAEQRRSRNEGQADELRKQWVHQQAKVMQLGTTDPPEATDDLAADWKRLVAWLDFERPVLERQVLALRQRADGQRSQRDRLQADIVASCQQAGLEVGDRNPRDVCVDARAEAAGRRSRIEDALAEQAHKQDERVIEDEKAQVSLALHRLLGANGFETWVLEEVLERLVEGATTVLHALSGGAYSLSRTDKNEFAVIDHGNADAVRIARTLSGGETFLASLALALALADRVADLSAVGGRRLEAIFLDEGFGTLDADTLDVVATAIEELGAQGRTVGVVTHVRELADRLPVRFEVTKGPEGASVQRVEV